MAMAISIWQNRNLLHQVRGTNREIRRESSQCRILDTDRCTCTTIHRPKRKSIAHTHSDSKTIEFSDQHS